MLFLRVGFFFIKWAMKAVGGLAFGIALLLLGYALFGLPGVSNLAKENPRTTAFLEDARARLKKQGANAPRIVFTWVPANKICQELKDAVVVAEDDRFYQHKGFDYTEIWNSFKLNLETGRLARGGSTITQQLAKNLFLSPDKTFRRKFDEMLLSIKMESSLSKERILELYLNVVDWGRGAFGAEAAAQLYFAKSAEQLTPAEAVKLAAMLPNPEYLSSSESRLRNRETMILAKFNKRAPGLKRERTILEQPDHTPGVQTVAGKGSEAVGKVGDAIRRTEEIGKQAAKLLAQIAKIEIATSDAASPDAIQKASAEASAPGAAFLQGVAGKIIDEGWRLYPNPAQPDTGIPSANPVALSNPPLPANPAAPSSLPLPTPPREIQAKENPPAVAQAPKSEPPPKPRKRNPKLLESLARFEKKLK